MEFLLTYGWAIIIIIVVVGALFTMGVFNTEKRREQQMIEEKECVEACKEAGLIYITPPYSNQCWCREKDDCFELHNRTYCRVGDEVELSIVD